MPVQHVISNNYWTPTPSDGTTRGQYARNNALSCGFPSHVNVWLDLEQVQPGTPVSDVVDYCNNWYGEVSAWGYIPGLYVGANCGLTPYELYYDLQFSHYWRSLSGSTPPVDVRGYQMLQSQQQPYYGVSIDRDTVQQDNSGGLPQWTHV